MDTFLKSTGPGPSRAVRAGGAPPVRRDRRRLGARTHRMRSPDRPRVSPSGLGGCGCNPCESPSGQSGTGACIDRRRYISSYEISKGYGTSAIHIKAPVFPARRDIREPSSPTEFPSPAGGRVRVKVEKIAPSAPRRNPARGVGRVVTQTVPAVPYSMPGAGSSSVRQQDSPTLPPSPQCRDACRSNDRRPMGPHPTGLHNSSSRAPRCIFPQPLRALSSGRTSTPSIMVNRRLSRF